METKTNEILRRLDDLISLGREAFYVKEFRKEISDEDVLGVIIAKKCKWARGPIMQTFLSALEDANFSTLAAKIEEL